MIYSVARNMFVRSISIWGKSGLNRAVFDEDLTAKLPISCKAEQLYFSRQIIFVDLTKPVHVRPIVNRFATGYNLDATKLRNLSHKAIRVFQWKSFPLQGFLFQDDGVHLLAARRSGYLFLPGYWTRPIRPGNNYWKYYFHLFQHKTPRYTNQRV